jgi:hypothetical protein
VTVGTDITIWTLITPPAITVPVVGEISAALARSLAHKTLADFRLFVGFFRNAKVASLNLEPLESDAGLVTHRPVSGTLKAVVIAQFTSVSCPFPGIEDVVYVTNGAVS